MSESKMNDVPKMDVPPALLAMGERIGNELILCGEKAVAHVAEPQGYPVAAGSLEQSLAARLGRIPAERRALAIQRVMPALKASSPERASRLGELAAVDLRSPEAVSAQVSRVAAPKLAQLSREQLAAMAPVRHRGLAEDVADRGGGDGTVQVRLRRVHCVETTGDVGTDEMALGGLLIDAAGNTTKISQFELPDTVGNTDDGDWAVFSPPRVLGTMTSPLSVSYPQTFTALYIFAELDNGGFPDFLSKALDWARPKAAEELGKLAAQGLEQYLGPVLAKAIGQVVAWLVDFALGKLIDWVKSVWEDDIFPPITDVRTIQGPANWNSGELMGWAKAHGGHYEIYVDWVAEFPLDRYFHIIAKHSGLCLNVAGGGPERGASVIQWPVSNSDNDKWRLEPAGDGYFHIIAKHSGLCLNVSGGGTERGASLIQWPVSDYSDNDKWRLEPAGDGYFHIIAKHSGLCLNVSGGGTERGAPLIQWPVSDYSDNDKWRLEQI